jgi:hypothetical protein
LETSDLNLQKERCVIVNMGLHEKWTGTIVGIRFQPADRAESTIYIDYFRMIEENNKWEKLDSADYWSTIYQNVVNNLEELFFDDFYSVNYENWFDYGGKKSIKTSNGNIIFYGNPNDVPTLHNMRSLNINEGILAKFQFSELVNGQIRFDSGNRNSHSEFGLGFNQTGFLTIKRNGNEFIEDNNLTGDLRFSPNKWFNMMLFNSDLDCLYLRVWDSGNPESFAEYVFPLDNDFMNRRWRVTVFANQGKLLLDWYKEIHY